MFSSRHFIVLDYSSGVVFIHMDMDIKNLFFFSYLGIDLIQQHLTKR